MLDWLFPNWSDPATVAAVVVLRLLLDVALVAFVARAAGRRSRATVLGAALTLLSAILMVSVLRPGGAGQFGSYLELAFHGVLLGLGGYAAYGERSTRRWLEFAALAFAALVLLLPAIVLYGEATVAP